MTLNVGTFNGERVFIPGKYIPVDLKRVLKPRKRTNNKAYTAKKGAPVRGKTGVGAFSPIPDESAGTPEGQAGPGLVPPFTLVSKETRIESVTLTYGPENQEIDTSMTWTDGNGVSFTLPLE